MSDHRELDEGKVRAAVRAAVERMGVAEVAKTLGLTEPTITRLVFKGQVRNGTLALALMGLPKLVPGKVEAIAVSPRVRA